MRRGSLRPRSLSTHRRGRIPVDYLRELVVITVIIALVLVLQQSFRPNAATIAEHPHRHHPVYALALSRGGEALWISREGYGLSEIDLRQGTECEHRQLCHAEASYSAHGGSDRCLTVRFGFDRSLELLRENEAVHSEVLPERFLDVTECHVSTDGRTAMIITGKGLTKIWREQSDGSFASRELAIPVGVDYAVLSHDGNRVIIVNPEFVTSWDLQNHREISRWKTTHGTTICTSWRGRAEAMALSSDGAYVALGFGDGTVYIWECATSQLVWESKADAYKMSALAFSPSGFIATAGFDKTVRLWDWRTDTLKWKSQHHTQAVHNLVFAADESRLYSGGLDGQVVEASALTGDRLRTLP